MSRTLPVLALAPVLGAAAIHGGLCAQTALPHAPLARSIEGRWEDPFQHDLIGFPSLLPYFNAIHMALIPKGPHRGKVIVFDSYPDTTHPSWEQRWSIVDVPASGPPSFENHELALPSGAGDFFCAGHAWSSHGNLFVAGGTSKYPSAKLHHDPGSEGGEFYGGKLAYFWNPSAGPSGTWIRQDDLAVDRWYPTVLNLGDGTLLVAGGIEESHDDVFNDNDYEAFRSTTPTSGSWVVHGSDTLIPGPGGFGPLSLYPRLFHLSTGEQFLAGMSGRSTRTNHALSPGAWMPTADARWDYRTYGTAVLLPLLPDRFGNYQDEVMLVGGYGADISKARSPETGDYHLVLGGTQALVETCRPGSADPADWTWIQAPSLKHRRMTANVVILADGTLLALGGRIAGGGAHEVPVLVPELFDGTRWIEMPPHASARTYHSTALLLPNATVLTGGGDSATWAYQVFVPGYLRSSYPRPVIRASPTDMAYGAEGAPDYTIEFADMPGARVARAVLVSPGAVTHHCDVNQRYIELVKVSTSATAITIEAPRDRNLVPPGYYMLFLLSSRGVPSSAVWLHVG